MDDEYFNYMKKYLSIFKILKEKIKKKYKEHYEILINIQFSLL